MTPPDRFTQGGEHSASQANHDAQLYRAAVAFGRDSRIAEDHPEQERDHEVVEVAFQKLPWIHHRMAFFHEVNHRAWTCFEEFLGDFRINVRAGNEIETGFGDNRVEGGCSDTIGGGGDNFAG